MPKQRENPQRFVPSVSDPERASSFLSRCRAPAHGRFAAGARQEDAAMDAIATPNRYVYP